MLGCEPVALVLMQTGKFLLEQLEEKNICAYTKPIWESICTSGSPILRGYREACMQEQWFGI